MATNKQRRDAERQRLQRQLEQRRQREVARKRFTLIASIVGTLVVIAAVVVGIVAATSGDDDNDAAGKKNASVVPTPSTSAPASSSSAAAKPCTTKGLPGVVSFSGVSVGNAANLKKEPKVCSSSKTTPTALATKDLVVGKGKAASPKSTVTVQYTGVLYQNGTQFDSSWARGQAATFSLAQVVPGFTQGIGGNGKTAPMKVGGRRIMILPSALGYGAQGSPPTIPANAPLVFVVDLVKVTG